MSDAITVSAPISGTDRTLTFETGKLAQLADGAVVGRIGDTVLLATATAARSVREGADFFPLTVDIEERAYAAGKIPGSFFRREGKSSDQAILTCRLIDRPLRPSFPKGFRNEVHIVGHHLRRRPGQSPRRPGHQRRLGRADDLGHPLRGADRGGPGGLLDRRPVDPAPQASRRVTSPPSSWWWPAGRLSDAADAEIAIMMVEAGGSERSFQYYEEGAPQVTEEVLADGLEAAKTWIRESIVLQRQMVEAYVAARGPIEPIEYSTLSDYGDDVWERVEAVGTGPVAAANTIMAKAERNAALDEATDRDQGRAGRRVPRPGGRDQGRRPEPDQEAGAQAHRRGGPPYRRPDHHRDPAAVGRGRPVPDGPRFGPVPAGRDPGAQRDHAGHAPDEPAARHHHARRAQAVHAPLQLPALLHRRDRVHAGSRSAGRSATACWPSGPCCRSSPTRRTSPTPSVWCRTCWPPTAPRRWRRSAARPCR